MKFENIFIFLFAIFEVTFGHAMLYKKNEQDKYEADLIPVSSTVIPLSVYEVSYGLGGKPSEEYKIAYLEKLRKAMKHKEEFEDPDTLITVKTERHLAQVRKDDAKIKGM